MLTFTPLLNAIALDIVDMLIRVRHQQPSVIIMGI